MSTGRERGTARERASAALWRVVPARLRRSQLQASLVGDTAATVLLNGGMGVFNLLTTFFLSRLLGAHGFGPYAYALGWGSALIVPATLGLAPLIVRLVAAYRGRLEWDLIRGLVRRSTQAVCAASIIIAGAAAAVGSPFVVRSGRAVLQSYLIALVIPLIASLGAVRQATMAAFGRVVFGRVPETLLQPAIFLGLVGLMRMALGESFSAPSAVAMHVTGAALAVAVGASMLRRTLPDTVRHAPPRYDTREWASRVPSLVLYGGLSAFSAHAGVVMLGLIRYPLLAGIYAVASRAAGLTSFLFIAASYALAPAISELTAQGDRDRLQRLLTRASRLLIACAVVVAVVVVVASDRLLRFFGPGFAGGRTTLIVLTLSELVNVATGPAALTLMLSGHERDTTRVAAVGGFAHAVLNFALIPGWGLVGAAVGAASARTLTNVGMLWLLHRRTGLHAGPLRPLGRLL